MQAGPRSPVRVVTVSEEEAARKRHQWEQQQQEWQQQQQPAPSSPPKPPRQTPQQIAQAARMAGASGPQALALAAAAAAEQEQEDENEFYRSFVQGKKQEEQQQRRQQQQQQQHGMPAASSATPFSEAQLEARKALAAGTYFIIGGIVTDSRGVELGPAVEVLGPEYADETPAPAPPQQPAPSASGGSPRRYTASKGAAAALQFANAQSGKDPAMPGRNALGASSNSRDLGALHGAGLNTLRGALSPRAPGGGLLGDRASEVSYDSYEAGLLPTMLVSSPTKAGQQQQPPTKLDLTTNWKPAGTGGVAGATIGAKASSGVAIKGGGGIMRSSAPTATRTRAEREANGDALS